ncbi:MAG: glycosyltransferase family 39 protein [Nitrospiraceae bacterium]
MARERWALLAAAVLLSATTLLLGWDGLRTAADPDWEDTAPYLELGLFLHEQGGPIAFPALCLTGAYRANNQHPLYPLLISPFAARNVAYFDSAKMVSLVMGLVAVLTCLYVGYSMFGVAAGIVAATLLALSRSFIQVSSHVACESTLIVWFLWWFYSAVRAYEHEGRAGWALAAGAFAGAAFLTKGTGLLLLPAYLGAHLWQSGWRGVVHRRPAFFVAMFVLIAAPLLVRNWVLYGSPTYGGINASVFWLDRWEDIFAPSRGLIRSWPEVVWHLQNPPTWRSYLATHSVADIVGRVERGVVGVLGLSQQATASSVPLGDQIWTYAVLGFGGLGLWRDRNRTRQVLVVLHAAALLGPLLWYYQVVPAVRFLVPLLSLLCLYAACGIRECIRWASRRTVRESDGLRIDRMLRNCLTGVLAALVASLLVRTATSTAPSPMTFTRDVEAVRVWMQTQVHPHDAVVTFNKNPYWNYSWYVGMQGEIVGWGKGHEQAPDGGEDVLRRLVVAVPKASRRWLLVHERDLPSLPVLQRFLSVDPQRGLIDIERARPAGWEIAFADPEVPARFVIYRLPIPTAYASR